VIYPGFKNFEFYRFKLILKDDTVGGFVGKAKILSKYQCVFSKLNNKKIGNNMSSFNILDEEKKQTIIDETETNLTALRRTIYLTIQSSLDHNECAHKLMKMQLKPGQEVELCNMILDCCAQQRTYEKFFGLLAQVSVFKKVHKV